MLYSQAIVLQGIFTQYAALGSVEVQGLNREAGCEQLHIALKAQSLGLD